MVELREAWQLLTNALSPKGGKFYVFLQSLPALENAVQLISDAKGRDYALRKKSESVEQSLRLTISRLRGNPVSVNQLRKAQRALVKACVFTKQIERRIGEILKNVQAAIKFMSLKGGYPILRSASEVAGGKLNAACRELLLVISAVEFLCGLERRLYNEFNQRA